MTTGACEVKNPSIDPVAMPAPLAGVLAPGQIVVLPASSADLQAMCPGIQNSLVLTDLPSTYAGPFDTSYMSAKTKRLVSVAAASIAANLAAASVAIEGASSVNLNFVAERDGSVTGFAGEMTVAVSGTQQLQVDVYKNGAAFAADKFGNHAQALVTTGNKKVAQTFPPEHFQFSAGDELSVRLTTSSGWSNTGSPLLGFLEVQM